MKLLLLYFWLLHFLEAILKCDPVVSLVFVDIFTVHTGEYLAVRGKRHMRNFSDHAHLLEHFFRYIQAITLVIHFTYSSLCICYC